MVPKWSLKKELHYVLSQDVVHRTYKMYNSRAAKRKAHLEETARSQGLFLYSLSDIYEIRWDGN